MIYIPAHINSEKFERLRSSKYTPSVSLSLDSSLREGAGNGCGELIPFIGVLAKPWGCGRFSSPLRNSDFFTVYVHRTTLPQSRIRSTAPSGREPGGGGAAHPPLWGFGGDLIVPSGWQRVWPLVLQVWNRRGTETRQSWNLQLVQAKTHRPKPAPLPPFSVTVPLYSQPGAKTRCLCAWLVCLF